MITDPSEIRRLAEEKRAENIDFRRYLKEHHCPEEQFHILACEIERQIDCTECANCCHDILVAISPAEIDAIAAFLGVPRENVVRECTLPNPDAPGARILRSLNGPCVFLEGKRCMIYDARPKPCREFPHSELTRRTLGGRMSSQCRRVEVCPIVYNTLEAYKHLVGYHPRT